MRPIKKIFFVLFFFQLLAAASADASDIFIPFKKPATSCDEILSRAVHQQKLDADLPGSNNNRGKHPKNRVRFLHIRTNNLTAILPARQLLPGSVTAFVKQELTQNAVRNALLPAYYHFLYRLSPF